MAHHYPLPPNPTKPIHTIDTIIKSDRYINTLDLLDL